jgi:hypothetical protein
VSNTDSQNGRARLDLISACMISALFLYYGGAEVPIEPARVHQKTG